jgi:hypothetical protein
MSILWTTLVQSDKLRTIFTENTPIKLEEVDIWYKFYLILMLKIHQKGNMWQFSKIIYQNAYNLLLSFWPLHIYYTIDHVELKNHEVYCNNQEVSCNKILQKSTINQSARP